MCVICHLPLPPLKEDSTVIHSHSFLSNLLVTNLKSQSCFLLLLNPPVTYRHGVLYLPFAVPLRASKLAHMNLLIFSCTWYSVPLNPALSEKLRHYKTDTEIEGKEAFDIPAMSSYGLWKLIWLLGFLFPKIAAVSCRWPAPIGSSSRRPACWGCGDVRNLGCRTRAGFIFSSNPKCQPQYEASGIKVQNSEAFFSQVLHSLSRAFFDCWFDLNSQDHIHQKKNFFILEPQITLLILKALRSAEACAYLL